MAGFVVAEVFATYARLSPRELYHVSGSGPAAGAGRAVVLLNFPLALVALPILLLVANAWRRRAINVAAGVAAVLCAAVFAPGVVDQADLDPRPVNAIAATGVVLAAVLTIGAASRLRAPPARADRGTLAATLVLLVVAVPWMLADLGIYAGHLPVLEWIYESDQWYAGLGHARLHRALHLGHHHGMDGTLLALVALWLRAPLARLAGRARRVLAAYLSLLFVYGLGNVLNDAWGEQIVKRGAVGWAVPSVLLPAANAAWLMVVALAVVAYYGIFRNARPAPAARRRVLAPSAVVAALGTAALVGIGATHDGGTHLGPRVPLATPTETIVFPYAAELGSHLYALTRGNLEQLTDMSGSDVRPAVSRGGRVAFQSSRDGSDGVYVARADGDPVRISDGGEPAWSPDGNRIAFVDDGDIYVARADGTNARRVARDAEWPAWFPDGERIAFDRGGDIWSLALASGDERRLTSGPADDRYPAVAHEGASVAFERETHGRWHLWLLSHGNAQLTSGPSEDFAPAFTADDKALVFLSDRDGNDQLFTIHLDTRHLRRLTATHGDKDAPTVRRATRAP